MVYVIRKKFYRKDNVNYALAVGIGDIICFSSWKKAEEYVKTKVAFDKTNYKVEFDVYEEDLVCQFVTDTAKKAKTYVERTYDALGYRVGYTIVQPKIW